MDRSGQTPRKEYERAILPSNVGKDSNRYDSPRSLPVHFDTSSQHRGHRHDNFSNTRQLHSLLPEFQRLFGKALEEFDENAQMHEKSNYYTKMERELKSKREKIDQLEQKNRQLENRNEDLKRDFDEYKSTEKQRFQNDTEQLRREAAALENEVERLKKTNDRFEEWKREQYGKDTHPDMQTIKSYRDIQKQLFDAKEELKIAKAQLEETKTRLSRALGTKLTDNNPNIADLSDKNRPTKISEQFQELYDNEWTDAFEKVHGHIRNDEKTITFLLETLLSVMEYCQSHAEMQMNGIRECLLMSEKQLPESIKKEMKDIRKRLAGEFGKSLYKRYFISKMTKLSPQKAKVAKLITTFIQKCFDVCWLMVVQVPPVVFAPIPRPGDPLNSGLFRFYTQSGNMVDYTVWPALLLHEDGPVLVKGTAQAFVEPTTTFEDKKTKLPSLTSLKYRQPIGSEQESKGAHSYHGSIDRIRERLPRIPYDSRSSYN